MTAASLAKTVALAVAVLFTAALAVLAAPLVRAARNRARRSS